MATISDLSDELLLEIFSHSLTFSSLFNPALSLGHLSTWSRILRHKKSLTLVCKRWNGIATPFLYRQVVLRRAGQLHALLHTLVDTTYTPYIQEITILDSCYVQDSKADLFLQNFQTLLQRCPKVLILNIRPFLHLPIPCDTFTRVPLPILTNLTLGPTFTTCQKQHLVASLATTLKMLAIHASPEDDWGSEIHFPALEQLRITLQCSSSHNASTSPKLPAQWTFAVLRSLTAVVGNKRIKPNESVLPFVVEHGEMLKHLSIRHFHTEGITYLEMASILLACPNLEHLATDVSGTLLLDTPEPINNLRTLDIFSYNANWRHVQKNFLPHIERYPDLKLIHFFSEVCLDNFFEHLPPHTDPIRGFKEALTWSMPKLDLRIDFLEKLVTDPSRGLSDICVYVVHPPSQYHPLADKWGPPVPVDEIGSEAYSDSEDSDSDSDSSSSMTTESSDESGCSVTCLLDPVDVIQ